MEIIRRERKRNEKMKRKEFYIVYIEGDQIGISFRAETDRLSICTSSQFTLHKHFRYFILLALLLLLLIFSGFFFFCCFLMFSIIRSEVNECDKRNE